MHNNELLENCCKSQDLKQAIPNKYPCQMLYRQTSIPGSFLNFLKLDTFDTADSSAKVAYGSKVPRVAKTPLMIDSVNCLIIDDDTDDQEIFSMALQDVTFDTQCRFFDDCGKALKELREDETYLPDCIFLDINMPRMNGVECLAEIKKIQKLASVPVCMISTSADPFIVEKTRSLGALDFVVKPSNVSELSVILERFIHLNVVSKP